MNINDYTLSTYSLLNLVITSVLIGSAIVVLGKKIGRTGAMLGFFMLAVALWTFTSALDLAAIRLEDKIFWSKIQYIGIFSIPGFLLLFVYYFYSNDNQFPRKLFPFLWVIPIITILLAFTNETHFLIWTHFSPSPLVGSNLIIYHHGLWFWIAFGYFYVVLAISIYLLIKSIRDLPIRKKRNARLMLLAFPFPVIGNLLYNFDFNPWPGYDLSAVGFSIASLILLWGVSRQNLIELTPVAREKLMEFLSDGVLIIDLEKKIADYNQAVLEILNQKGYDLSRNLRNLTVNQVIEEMPDLTPIFKSKKGYPLIIPAITADEPTLEIVQQSIIDEDKKFCGIIIIIRDITVQKKAEVQLLWHHQRLAAEQERQKMGRELHDNLAQVLGYINFQSKTIRNLFEEGEITSAMTGIAKLIDVSEEATNDVRAFIQNTRQDSQEKKGFLPAINSYIESFRKLTNLPISLNLYDIDIESISTTKNRLHMLRIIQEALSNIQKHANAKSIQINFSQTPKSLIITIIDDGDGFDPFDAAKEGHFGINIMQERAKEAGGYLDIRSEIGKGTTIQVSLPVIQATHQELKKLKYMVVDDHPLFLDGIKNLLASKGLEVIATAKDGNEALVLLKDFHPDIILMDVHMPGLSGQETTRQIKKRYPKIKILLLTMSDSPEDLQNAIHSGVDGYILKNQSSQELFTDLERIVNEPLVISAEMTKRLLEQRIHHPAMNIDFPSALYELSAVELDILERVANGEGYKEIGVALNLSPHTIKYHFNKVMSKMEIENRAEAIQIAIRSGLIKGRRSTDPAI
ncbi:MAG TPA: histidine kinase N-terminal 7TM domain-containing protein [Anaerolineaceae bacterium]|nr:histidine kinase N-terminal 7TM domain-containing protein [Anaerolineaceae bacterium]